MTSPEEKKMILESLTRGEIALEGQFMWGSNYTFLCEITHQGTSIKAVYKPTQGERPLWDFPSETLARRETAAYLVSEAGGWQMVPPTVYRQEGPAGPGSLQLYIEHDPDHHYFTFTSKETQRLRPVALFDAVINNTDRKGGHILLGPEDKLWLIDHGICFHIQPKLRTVVWDFAGEPLSDEACQRIGGLGEKLAAGQEFHGKLADYLSRAEIQAMTARINVLLETGVYPHPTDRRYSTPWPPV